MSPHLAAKLLKPASPLLRPDSAIESDDDDMVYSPYYTTHRRSSSCSKRRRSHQLSPDARAEIVARVLDPAYSGRKEYTSRVFVDPNGDEHDPDFQLFPTITPRLVRNSSEDLSQDGYDSEAEWTRSRAASPYTNSAATTPSPPTNPLSLFGDDEWDEKEWTREIVVPVPQSKRSKRKATPVLVPSPVRASSAAIHEDECAPARHSSVKLVREDTIDTVDTVEEAYVTSSSTITTFANLFPISPSCGYVLRRQWATIALHTRLSAHRIARRARRAVSVGT